MNQESSRKSGAVTGAGTLRKKGLPVPFVDVVFVLIMVFMIQARWIQHSTHEGDLAQEFTLPAINLSVLNDQYDPSLKGDKPRFVIVSVEKGAAGPELHYGKDVITVPELKGRLAGESPQEVCLRVGDEVTHGEVMQVMGICRDSGVPGISFAYRNLEGR